MVALNPKFDSAYIAQLRAALQSASAEVKAASEEVDAALESLEKAQEGTHTYSTLLKHLKIALTRFDKLDERRERLRQLLDSLGET